MSPHAPEGLPYPAAALARARDLGRRAGAVSARCRDAWAGLERVWAGGRGFAAIRRLWLERAAGLGERVAVSIGGEVVSGVFETIDDDGAAGDPRRRRQPARRSAAGEVHFGAVATVQA